MKKIAAIKISLVFFTIFFAIATISSVVSCQNTDVSLFDGSWSGKWISDKKHHDNALVKALIQVDVSTGTASVIMFQLPDPPAPPYSSLSIGKIVCDKIVIDAASSGIGGGGSELIFWIENPLILRGSYKNDFDSGTFEFRRYSRKDA